MANPKVPALRLALGGAPATWHSVDGLLGFYHPDIPTPVGGDGECPLEAAQAAAALDGAPVELLDITEAQASKARDALAEHLKQVTRALHDDGAQATRQQVDATVESLAGPGAAAPSTSNEPEGD